MITKMEGKRRRLWVNCREEEAKALDAAGFTVERRKWADGEHTHQAQMNAAERDVFVLARGIFGRRVTADKTPAPGYYARIGKWLAFQNADAKDRIGVLLAMREWKDSVVTRYVEKGRAYVELRHSSGARMRIHAEAAL